MSICVPIALISQNSRSENTYSVPEPVEYGDCTLETDRICNNNNLVNRKISIGTGNRYA